MIMTVVMINIGDGYVDGDNDGGDGKQWRR